MPSAAILHLNQVQGEGRGGCSPVLDAAADVGGKVLVVCVWTAALRGTGPGADTKDPSLGLDLLAMVWRPSRSPREAHVN